MPLGLDQIREDRFLTQCLAGLKPMQTVHQYEAISIAPDKDWGRLALLKHTFRNLSHIVRVKRPTALYGYIDVCDRDFFAFQHGLYHVNGTAMPLIVLASAPVLTFFNT